MLQKLDFLRQMDVIQTNTLVAGYTGWRLAKSITNLPSSFAMNSMVHFGIRWEGTLLERRVYPTIEMRIARFPLVISILKQLDVYKGVKDEEEHHKY